MSGSIGGSRIKRESVQSTFNNYVNEVLKGFPGFVKAEITGSYNAGIKDDHGDLDLVILVRGFDLKLVKKNFKNYINSISDRMPVFSKGNHIGEVSQMYGSIVTCGWWIDGGDDWVQVDNIIVLSEQDMEFQKEFLNLDAPKQALLMGLIRVILNKIDIYSLFDKTTLGKKNEDQEYEFVLSSSGLSLRLVTLNEDYKELDRKEIWRTTDWNIVKTLTRGLININDPYEQILSDIYSMFYNDDRSCRRIVGIMKSMIRVGPGEVGTPKGFGKENAIMMAEKMLLNKGNTNE